MKNILPFLFGAVLLPIAAQAVTTTSNIVGYVSIGDTTVGQPSVKANTDVFVSIPLDRSTAFAGTVASVAGNVITLSGTPGLGTYSDPTNPHWIKMQNGAKSGLIALITANDASSVTVSAPVGDPLSGIVPGDKISIDEAWTVLEVMGTSVPPLTQVLGFSGSFTGQNPAADLIYEFDGTNWIDTNSFEIADNTVLFPSETFIIRNQSASPITGLVITGQVPLAYQRTVVASSGTGTDNLSSYFGAVGEVIGTSGLSAIANALDQILAFNNNAAGQNKAATSIIEYDGAAWIDTNSFEDVTNTFKLESGVGYIFRRANTSPAGDAIWTDQPDYVSGL